MQADGKIVAAGVAAGEIGIARYNADGSLDTTFGGDGRVTTDPGGFGPFAAAVVIQTDGKIVVAGGGDIVTATLSEFVVLRYNPDGSFDKGFGSGGMVFGVPDGPGSFADVVLQPDGKIVAAGQRGDSAGIAVARYNEDGSADSTFGGDGLVTTPLGAINQLRAVAIQHFVTSFKIVVAGNASGLSGLARFNPDGSLDTNFGFGGAVTTNFTL